MAYDYLEDGTPFVALEINDRFNSEVRSINEIRPETAFARGALGPQHLPSIVGRQDKQTSRTKGWHRAEPFSDTVMIRAPLYGTETDIIGPWTFSAPYSNTDCSALVVLFNVVIERFFYNDLNIGRHPNIDSYEPVEDTAVAEFVIEYEDDRGSWWPLQRTKRTVSPGQTMFEVSGNGFNRFQQDDMSDKDVPIRTVIELGDYDIYGLRVRCRTFQVSATSILPTTGFTFSYSKYNINVIPIYADVVRT